MANITSTSSKSSTPLKPSMIQFILADQSGLAILFSNLLTLGMVLGGQIDGLAYLWVFFFQSLVIGFFGTIKILTAKTIRYRYVNRLPCAYLYHGPNIGATLKFLFFFLFFSSTIFAALYSVSFGAGGRASWDGHTYSIRYFMQPGDFSQARYDAFIGQLPTLAIPAILFFFSHLWSFATHWPKENTSEKNLLALGLSVFLRFLPMEGLLFVGMTLGGLFNASLFIVLKTLADLLLHYAERGLFSIQVWSGYGARGSIFKFRGSNEQ